MWSFSRLVLAITCVFRAADAEACNATVDCNGHGTTSDTDKTDGCICECSAGYIAGNCSQEVCDGTAHCSGHGNTTDDNPADGCTCQCNDGFYGDDCSAVCDGTAHCNGHGSSTDDNPADGCTCQCNDGFSGDDCSEDTRNLTLYESISRVCLKNHAGFGIRFAVMSSDGQNKTDPTGWFSMPMKRCLDLKDIPEVQSGDNVKTEVMVAGKNSFLEGIKYSPSGIELTYTCRGAIWDFICTPDILPPVDAEKVCVTNRGGFLMYFILQDTSSGEVSARTERYAYSDSRCINLKDINGIDDGAEVLVTIQPMAGRRKDLVNQTITYKRSGLQVDYVCKGATLNYYCIRGDAATLKQTALGGNSSWLNIVPQSANLKCITLLAFAMLVL